MIFVDANIPMYIVGDDDDRKRESLLLVEQAIVRQRRLVTSAEVLQEILHRYTHIRRPEAIDAAFRTVDSFVDAVLPVTAEDVRAARRILDEAPAATARDALHVAVMRAHGISEILSFDRHFDGVEGISRISR